MVPEKFHPWSQRIFLAWGNIIILLKLIQTFALVALEWTCYTAEKKFYMYLPISKTWNQVIQEKIMGKYFSLFFCNYFMVFFSVNPTAYTYFVAKCQILTRQRWLGKNTISDLRGRKCDKYLNTEHLLLSCWSLVCSLWKQRSNNYFTFVLNIWSC